MVGVLLILCGGVVVVICLLSVDAQRFVIVHDLEVIALMCVFVLSVSAVLWKRRRERMVTRTWRERGGLRAVPTRVGAARESTQTRAVRLEDAEQLSASMAECTRCTIAVVTGRRRRTGTARDGGRRRGRDGLCLLILLTVIVVIVELSVVVAIQ